MDTRLLTALRLAEKLNVPLAWLRSEADAGRLPHLRAGHQILFDSEAVEVALLKRAAKQPQPQAQAGEGVRRGH